MFKLFPLLLTFFFSFSLPAENETLKKIDVDKNQKDDRFEYYLNEKLVRVEEDLNNDGKIDFKTIYNDGNYFEVTEQDINFDGKFERKQFKKHNEKNQVEIYTEIDKDQNGKVDVSYNQTVESDQKQTESECFEQYINQSIDDLISSSLEVTEKFDNGFIATDFGYKIDNGCMKRWGNRFISIAKNTIETGMQCLLRLHKQSAKNGEITGALRNAYKLSDYIKNTKTTIVCSETNFNWTKTAAHASATINHSIKEPKVEHPFISINSNYPKITKKPNKDELHEINKTIFHEQMHTLGYLHEDNIEYSFSCEDCCLDKRMSKKERALSCKICTGNYANESDKNYIKDIVLYARTIRQDKLGISAAIRYLKEYPNDVLGLAYFAYAAGNIYNPVAPEFAQIVLDRKKTFTKEQIDFLHEAGTYEGSDIFLKSKDNARIVATGIYEIYENGNKDGALQLFEKYQDQLKNGITPVAGTPKNIKRVAEEIKRMILVTLHDIWFNTRPINKTAIRAYKLYEFFNK